MLLILTIGLVLVGAVSLVIGFVSQDTAPIYISIACSLLAGIVLFVFSRMSRRQPTPAVAGGPGVSDATLADNVPAATTAFTRTEPDTVVSGDGVFPIDDYDELLVSEIVPLLPELDLEELDQVRAREEQGKNRASILRRIDALAAELEGGPEPEAEADEFAEAEEAQEAAFEPADDEGFPIADYDTLRVNQILPLLPELDDDELDVVAEREETGANRASILNRVRELQGGPVTQPVKKAPARKAPARKAPARKAPARKAPAKKTTAKKTPAKKTAAKKTTAKKAAAKKTTAAKRAPAKKTTAKKAAKRR